MTVAFFQMVNLHTHKSKELKIVFKSKIIEWYFFLFFEFALIPKTWLTLPVLQRSNMAPAPGSLISICCYEYHELIVFMLMTVGIILFVVSLQEGFYSYQFRMLGWTLLSALLIIAGCSGLLLSLWMCRMWFFYSVCCVTARNLVDHLVGQYFPLKTGMSMLKPEATFEGFIAGIFASFSFLAVVSILSITSFFRISTSCVVSLSNQSSDLGTYLFVYLFSRSNTL